MSKLCSLQIGGQEQTKLGKPIKLFGLLSEAGGESPGSRDDSKAAG